MLLVIKEQSHNLTFLHPNDGTMSLSEFRRIDYHPELLPSAGITEEPPELRTTNFRSNTQF